MIEGEISQAPFWCTCSAQQRNFKIIRLDPHVTYIGRMPENHIVLDDNKVSRSHARIVYEGGDYYIEDQDSENAILINGTKSQREKLKVGDQILVGSHMLNHLSADESIQPVSLNDQVDLHHDEEWRLDETISIRTGALSQGKVGKPKSETRNTKSELPKLHLTLKIGDDVIIRDIVLDKGKKLKAPVKPGDNALFIALKVGQWVLEKKIDLE
ncbi:MAG: FHA domain-containing protein [Bdellovibrionota bacterium]